MTVQPGWYADPADPTTQRWWDGEGWVGDPLPIDATPPPGPPPARPSDGQPTGTPGSGAPASAGTTPAGTTTGASAGATTGAPAGASQAPLPAGTAPATPPPGTAQAAPPPPPGTAPAAPGAPPGWPYPPYGYPLPPGYVLPPPRPHGYALAPFGPRLVARLIDIGVVLLLNVLVNGFFVWRFVQEIEPLLREAMRRSMAGDRSTDGLPQVSPEADGLQVVILLIAAALWFAYEVPSLANSGQTLGKRLMGIKVVPLTADEPLGFGRSMRRWNLLGLPTLLWCCGLGFLLQLLDCVFPVFDRPLRQALHDKRAQTVVVHVPRRQAATSKPPVPPR